MQRDNTLEEESKSKIQLASNKLRNPQKSLRHYRVECSDTGHLRVKKIRYQTFAIIVKPSSSGEKTQRFLKNLIHLLRSQPFLRTLELSTILCRFPKHGLQILDPIFNKMKNLSHLDMRIISSVGLTNMSLFYLKRKLKSLKNLKKLQFNGSQNLSLNAKGIVLLIQGYCYSPHIESLNLDFNNFMNFSESPGFTLLKHLPRNFQKIKSLRLGLEKTSIKDDHLKEIGLLFGRLKNLQTLSLSIGNNQLITDLGISYLKMASRLLTSLKSIDIDISLPSQREDAMNPLLFQAINPIGYNLTEKSIGFLQEILAHSGALNKLSFRIANNNNFFTPLIFCVSNAIKTQQKLDELSLDLTGWTKVSIENHFHSRPTLQRTDLTEESRILQEALLSLHHIRSLSLIFTKSPYMTDSSVEILTEAIRSLLSLERLHLNYQSSYEITDDSLKAIGLAIDALKGLYYLDLDFRFCKSITDKGIMYLRRGLGSLNLLLELNISLDGCPRLSDDCLTHLSESFWGMSRLRQLALTFEKCYPMTNEGVRSLTKAMKSLTRLQGLELNFVNCYRINDEGLRRIQEAVSSLKKLTRIVLDLQFCSKITESQLNSAKAELKHLPYVRINF